MSVKTALALINRVWGEIENELDANFDPATQVALAWFATYGFDTRASGELITLANAKNIPSKALFRSGVFENLHGKAGLTPRETLPKDWSPATDKNADRLGMRAAHRPRAAAPRMAAPRRRRSSSPRWAARRRMPARSPIGFTRSPRKKGWAAEALVYNELAEEWTHLEDPASRARRARGYPADLRRTLRFGAPSMSAEKETLQRVQGGALPSAPRPRALRRSADEGAPRRAVAALRQPRRRRLAQRRAR